MHRGSLRKLRFVFVLVVAAGSTYSCSIRKRLHLPGHHVSWRGSKSDDVQKEALPATGKEEVNLAEQLPEKRNGAQTRDQQADSILTAEQEMHELITDREIQLKQESGEEKDQTNAEMIRETTAKSVELSPVKTTSIQVKKPATHWLVILIIAMAVLALVFLLPGILLLTLLTGTFVVIAGIILVLLGAIVLGFVLYMLWLAANI